MTGKIAEIVKEFGTPKTLKTNDKLTSKTKNLIKERNALRAKFPKSTKEKIQIVELNKLTRKEIRNTIKNYNNKIATEIIEGTWSTKKAKKALSTGKPLLVKLKKEQNGKLIFNRVELVELAADFYAKLYSKEPNETNNTNIPLSQEQELPIPPILPEETRQELKNLKIGKISGPDKIENETLKNLRKALVEPLTKLFNIIIETGVVPKQWGTSEIIILYKKGEKSDINNYRPISLSANIGKLFCKILKNRLYPILMMHQPVEQAGFRQGYSTLDHVHSINQLIEKCKEYGMGSAFYSWITTRPLTLCFTKPYGKH